MVMSVIFSVFVSVISVFVRAICVFMSVVVVLVIPVLACQSEIGNIRINEASRR